MTAALRRVADRASRRRSSSHRSTVGGIGLAFGLAVLASLMTACAPGSGPAPDEGEPGPSLGGRPQRYETGAGSEAFDRLSVPTRADSASKRVLYSQPLSLTSGQVLLAVAEFQVTNDLGYNVFVASQIILADSPTAVRGRAITAANGRNVTPNMHHDQQTKSGTYACDDRDTGTRYVNLVVWSAASRAAPGDLLDIDEGYGDLSVLVW